MIVLDTNVVSEALRPQPDAMVIAWLSSRPSSSLFITTVTKAELLYGVRLLPDGQRRHMLNEAVQAVLTDEFRGRLLPFDGAAADAYAMVAADRRQLGKPIKAFDAQIAAIARSRGASVATRNVDDFEECGVDVLNPWSAS